MNIPYLLLFKIYTWSIFIIKRCWWWPSKFDQVKSFVNNIGLFLTARKKVFNNSKSRLFPVKNLDKSPTRKSELESKPEIEPEPVPEPKPEHKPDPKLKKSLLKLKENS